MRLNETSAHAWDVRVAFDSDAGIEASSADLVVEHLRAGSASCWTSPPSRSR